MTIHRTARGTRSRRDLRSLTMLGATACIAAVVTGCFPAGAPDAARTTDPATTAPAADGSGADPTSDDGATQTTIPFRRGHIPEFWVGHGDVACGSDVADLVTQDDRFRLELTGPTVKGTDDAAYQPVLLEHELGDEASLNFGDDVQLVWSQGGVVVDLGHGWREGGGPILHAPDAQGLPTSDYSAWEKDAADPALRRTSGLVRVPIETTCWPSEEDEELADGRPPSYDAPRPDDEYEVRAALVTSVDGESRLVVSDPVQCGVMAVMAVSDSALFDIARQRGQKY
jgi:hypothetical protein